MRLDPRRNSGPYGSLNPLLEFAVVLLVTCSCRVAAPKTPTPATIGPIRAQRAELQAQGSVAYDKGDWAACAALFEQAGDAYNAACCHAKDGAADRAFDQLARALDDGFDNLTQLKADPDLAALHADPRWATMIAGFEERTAAHRATLNVELAQIFEDDQADRAAFPQIDWSKVGPRDKAREQRVDEILAAGGAKVSDDYYHAAMVYQHGEGTAAIARAHELALKAVEIDPRNRRARWLAAASEDRLLVRQGKRQKWGTQYSKKEGQWVLDEFDPTITDDQRAEWDVPPLAEAQAQAKRMNESPK